MESAGTEGGWDIQQVVVRVARCSDRMDIGAMVENFAEDAVVDAGGRRVQGRDAIFEFFGGASAAPSEKERTKHVITNTLVDSGADGVEATSYWQVLRSWGVANWGRYVDRFVSDGDRWRIVHRSVVVDGTIPRPQASPT